MDEATLDQEFDKLKILLEKHNIVNLLDSFQKLEMNNLSRKYSDLLVIRKSILTTLNLLWFCAETEDERLELYYLER
jgi:hypothetical protein